MPFFLSFNQATFAYIFFWRVIVLGFIENSLADVIVRAATTLVMEQSNVDAVFAGTAILKIPVQALQPVQAEQSTSNNPPGTTDVELPSTFTNARILKLPPGYVILKDAEGNFQGLARVPMNIPAPVQIAEPPKKQPVVLGEKSLPNKPQTQPVQIALPPKKQPVVLGEKSLPNKPQTQPVHIAEPPKKLTVVLGEKSLPNKPQTQPVQIALPPKKQPVVLGKNSLPNKPQTQPVHIAEPPKKLTVALGEKSLPYKPQTQPDPSPQSDTGTQERSSTVQSQGDPKVVTSVTGKRQIHVQSLERTATTHQSSPQVAAPVAKTSPIPIQPKGPLPKIPWCRDHSRDPPQPWRKEPLVLYSGAPLKKDKTKNEDDADENTDDESTSRRKKKEPPPQSLPCPEKLDAILPKSSFKYHIASFQELSSPDRFKTEVRANINDKEAALKWIREFEEVSGTNFRVAKSFKENSQRLIFKKCFRCHKNTLRKENAVRATARHVGCLARVGITIKNPLMKQSNDPLLKEFPCVLSIHHNHCHSLTTLDSLQYRRPLPEVREKFAMMFKAGITPTAALRLHKLDLEKKYGDRYPEVVKDAAKCPLRPWCYKVYYDVCGARVKDGKKKVGKRSRKKKPESVNKKTVSQPLPEGSFLVTLSDDHTQPLASNCDEVQSSINSLYQYEYMSSSNIDRENDMMDCEGSGVLVDNSEILEESDANASNLLSKEDLLENVDSEGFQDDAELLIEEECLDDFEDSCENSDQVTRSSESVLTTNHANDLSDSSCENSDRVTRSSESVLTTNHANDVCVKRKSENDLSDTSCENSDQVPRSNESVLTTHHVNDVSDSSCENSDQVSRSNETVRTPEHANDVNDSLVSGDHSSDATKAIQDLKQIFDDIKSKLVTEPGVYLPAVRNFVTNFQSTSKSNNPYDLASALFNFGSKNVGSSILSPGEDDNVSKIVGNLTKRNAVRKAPERTGSPKRKVLVLRMDPNKFNSIIRKVSLNQTQKEAPNM